LENVNSRDATFEDIDTLSTQYAEIFIDNKAYKHIFQLSESTQHFNSLKWLFSKRLSLLLSTFRGPFKIVYDLREPKKISASGGCVLNSLKPGIWDMIQAGILEWPYLWGLSSLWRALALDDELHNNIKVSGIVYDGEISMIGVRPDQQGKGVGSFLLNSLLSDSSLQGKSLCLQTQKEINVSFYKKFGFSELYRDELHGFSSWTMVRPSGL